MQWQTCLQAPQDKSQLFQAYSVLMCQPTRPAVQIVEDLVTSTQKGPRNKQGFSWVQMEPPTERSQLSVALTSPREDGKMRKSTTHSSCSDCRGCRNRPPYLPIVLFLNSFLWADIQGSPTSKGLEYVKYVFKNLLFMMLLKTVSFKLLIKGIHHPPPT